MALLQLRLNETINIPPNTKTHSIDPFAPLYLDALNTYTHTEKEATCVPLAKTYKEDYLAHSWPEGRRESIPKHASRTRTLKREHNQVFT